MDHDDPALEYLSRSDIARILKISAKQAGRLMNRMPAIRVGQTHRRVLRADFDAWRFTEREVRAELPAETAMRVAMRVTGAFQGTEGSVVRAAQALKNRTEKQ